MTEKQALKRFWYWVNHPALAPFGLTSWDIDVGVADEPEGHVDANASVSSSDQYNKATVTFRRGYVAEASPDQFDVTAVHELVHMAMRDINNAEHSICQRLSPAEEDLYHDHLTLATENFVDNLARVLARGLPKTSR